MVGARFVESLTRVLTEMNKDGPTVQINEIVNRIILFCETVQVARAFGQESKNYEG